MSTWEYKIVDLSDGGLFNSSKTSSEEALNKLGDQGWELAALTESNTVERAPKWEHSGVRVQAAEGVIC